MVVIAFVGLLLWGFGVSTTELLRSSSSSASKSSEPVVDPLLDYLRGEFSASLQSKLQLNLETTVKEMVKSELHEVIQGEVKALAKVASEGQAELQSFKLSEAGLAASRSKLAGDDEASKKRLEAFNYIFDNNVWTSSESRSGPGSEVDESAGARAIIDFAIEKFGIQSIVDGPCGDFNWQHHIRNFAKINYTGLDIVPQLVLDNSIKHLSDLPNARFANVDLVSSPALPYADLYIVRDVVQHLNFDDGKRVYQNVARSGAKYLVTTMHFDPTTGAPESNHNINMGQYYFHNPMLPPFNFPEPLYYTRDMSDARVAATAADWTVKGIGLWRLDGMDLVGRGTGEGFSIDLKSTEIYSRAAE